MFPYGVEGKDIACRHRVWPGKFQQHAYILLHKHVSVQLRLILFKAVITPRLTDHMTKTEMVKRDALEKGMVRLLQSGFGISWD